MILFLAGRKSWLSEEAQGHCGHLTISCNFDQFIGPVACLPLPPFESLPYTAIKKQKAGGVAQGVKHLPCNDIVTHV